LVIKTLDPDWIPTRIGIQPKMLDPYPYPYQMSTDSKHRFETLVFKESGGAVACLVDKREVQLDEHLLNVEAEEGLGSVLGHHAPWQLDDFLIIKHSYKDCVKRQGFLKYNVCICK
jgi:hypothetical protein